jgi:hypothetical protein
MSKFFFDLRYDDEPWFDDTEGSELALLEEARSEAVGLMAEITKDSLRKYWKISIRLRDHERTPLLTLTLSMRAEGEPYCSSV